MNMKKMTLVLWLMALLTTAFAGDNDSIQRSPIKGVVKVSGTLSAIKTGRLYLFESFGRSVSKLDSTLITSGAFEFPQREVELGIYMIGLNENNMCPVILNPAEKEVTLRFGSAKLETSMSSENSRENQGWGRYMQQEPGLLKAIKDARVGAAKNPEQKATFEATLAAKEKELFDLQNTLMKE